jgi:ATP-dependent Clp protease adaptor protein ClpS
MTEKYQPKDFEQSKDTALFNIILYNDDVNTFDYVIEMLMRYCDHTLSQAEQCALLTHYKGKSIVKKGSIDVLVPIANTLLDKGLNVEIK